MPAGPELPNGTDPLRAQGDRSQAGVPGGDPESAGSCLSCPVRPGSDPKGEVVDANVVAPLLVLRVEPVYPETPRKLHQEGRVVLEAIIATNGSIEEIRVVSSANVLFDEAAVKAVGQWRYEPCLFAGRPARVRLLVTVQFRLNGR